MGWWWASQGKVISRSQQGQISSKRLKIAFYVVFNKIMFTWDVFDGSKHSWTQTWTYAKIPPRGYSDNIRVGGFFTRHEITLVSTLSDTAEMDQNNTLMLCHLKVTARSNQLKISENNLFLLILLQLCSLEMPMMAWSIPNPNTDQYQETPQKVPGWLKGLRGYTPSNHPCVSPIWYSRNEPNITHWFYV